MGLMKSIELFMTGLALVAAAETRFDVFVSIWNGDITRVWECQASAQQWAFQQLGWGDFNRPEGV